MQGFRFYATVSAVCLLRISYGMFLGWSLPIIPKLLQQNSTLKLTPDEASWTLSFLMLGRAIGSMISIFVVDAVGRKAAILLAVLPAYVSWLIMAWANKFSDLYASRIIGGVADGIVHTAGSIYVAEIAPAPIRGALGSFFVLMNYFGCILGYGIGYDNTMRVYSFVSIALLSVSTMIFACFPETPYFLISSKHFGTAMNSLMFLRGSQDVSTEINSIMMSVDGNLIAKNIFFKMRYLLSSQGGKRVIAIGVGIMLTNAASGWMILLTYAHSIFEAIENLSLKGIQLSVVLSVTCVISYILSIVLIDNLGRKPLLIASSAGVVVCTLILGSYFWLQKNDYDVIDYNWLPLLAALLYIFSISIGLGSVPIIVMNEIFPMYIKGGCAGLCFTVDFLCNFVILKLWPVEMDALNESVGFWTLSMINLISILYFSFILPETKRATLLEIQNRLMRRK